jgi:hypothetical protein
MTNIVILSGPGSYRTQLVTALSDAGYVEPVPGNTFNHTLPDTADGGTDATQSFITVESSSEDPTPVVTIAATVGWVLRAHYPEEGNAGGLVDMLAPLVPQVSEDVLKDLIRQVLTETKDKK